MTPPKFIFAVDPGITHHGWALLEVTSNARARYVASGHSELSPAALVDSVRASPIFLFAIEVPVVVHTLAAVRMVMHTRGNAGAFAAIAEDRGYQVAEFTANEWRKQLCGKNNASDADVKLAVQMFVEGWPVRSNAHERDAAGLALVARGWGRPRRIEIESKQARGKRAVS